MLKAAAGSETTGELGLAVGGCRLEPDGVAKGIVEVDLEDIEDEEMQAGAGGGGNHQLVPLGVTAGGPFEQGDVREDADLE